MFTELNLLNSRHNEFGKLRFGKKLALMLKIQQYFLISNMLFQINFNLSYIVPKILMRNVENSGVYTRDG